MITIVCGLPCSGKGDFVNSVAQAYELSYLHNEWIEDQYKAGCVRDDIATLFGGCLKYDPRAKGDFHRAVNEAIEKFPSLNAVLMNYFDAKYACLIAALAPYEAKNIIECPFLDANIAAIKEAYPENVHIIWMNTPDDIEECLKSKNWNEERTARTFKIKTEMYARFKGIIDEYVEPV